MLVLEVLVLDVRKPWLFIGAVVVGSNLARGYGHLAIVVAGSSTQVPGVVVVFGSGL